MPFRRQDPAHRAQPGGVRLSPSNASLDSFSSSASSSIFPAAPPSNSSQSDIATPDRSLHASPSALKSRLPPDTIFPVPRSSSLLPAMGQAPSRPQLQQPVPPPSPSKSPSSGSAGSRLRRVFGGRRKKSDDVSPHPAPILSPVPSPMGKSRSVTTPAYLTVAPDYPHRPAASAGPGYPSSLSRHPSPADYPPKPLPEPPHADPNHGASSSSDQRSSIMPTSPGISAALQYISENENADDVGLVMRRPRKRDSDHEGNKEDWRKSDSTTTSYYTVRPRSGTSGGARTPRPVSMAESLQSNSTVVPAGKRLSALLTEAEFIMTEEDVTHSGPTPLSRKTSPSGSSKARKRHSISLSFSSPLPSNQPASSGYSSDAHSSRPGFKHRPSGDVPTLSRAAANGIIAPSRSEDSHSTGSHIRGNLAAWSTANTAPPSAARALLPPPPSPSQPGHLRQTAISVTNGLAPAAGFAMGFGKRAVERMGRAFGSLGSSHNGSGHSSSSSSIAGMDDFGRSASNLSVASHFSQAQTGKGKQRRTPNAPSGAWSVNSTSSVSTGHTDQESFGQTLSLGTRLRGPMRNASGTAVVGGLVFGRDLKSCVRDTAIESVRASPAPAESQTGEASSTNVSIKFVLNRHLVSPNLHERRLPALVVRCAEHLMKWGAEEEGLFRISGRATHVARLRSEFDTGADYDMLECAPGDLDPHAVASIFKTYLRELPEPILTHALGPFFEAAMLTETNVRKSMEEHATPGQKTGAKGPPLPSGPRDGHALRKPPSLSTLAMPNFSGMRPPSQALLNAFASLVARLPQENRDLLRTVIDLVNFVAERKEIRMPLSNLTLVLCPTLNMNPPTLRVLCEAGSIWDGPPKGWEDSSVLDAEGEASESMADGEIEGANPEQEPVVEADTPRGDLDGQASASEVLANASDIKSDRRQASGGTDADDYEEDTDAGPALDDRASYASATDSRPSTPAWGKGSVLDPWSPPALTSSSDSLTTPSMSSEAPSIPQGTVPALFPVPTSKKKLVPAIIPDFVRQSPLPSPHPVAFPGIETAPGTPSSARHSTHLSSLPLLPSESGSQSPRLARGKRPSLTALFSKKSMSSLRSSRLFSSSSSSSPYLDARDSLARSSPASPRTPGSISPSIISGPALLPQRSSSSLPPLLSTPIDSSLLGLAGLREVEQPAEEEEEDECERPSEDSRASASASRKSSRSPLRRVESPVQSPASNSSSTPVTAQFRKKAELTKLPVPRPEPLQPQLSDDSFVSVASATSYHRLSLWEDDADTSPQDDWAKSVFKDVGWSPTTVEHSAAGGS
ncbi:hypothetical protein BC834DRAFT_968086 [Gloeopeniophorella convolvens]|nr:hypothetical protein BC834DRAFT_968086 [Gloeopeniophorella convolvens]